MIDVAPDKDRILRWPSLKPFAEGFDDLSMGVAAFASDGTIWVGDGAALKTVDKDGKVAAMPGVKLDSITGLAFDKDRVLVVDQSAKTLYAYTAKDGLRPAAGGFTLPVGVAAGEAVYVKEGKGVYREIPPVWKIEAGKPQKFVEGK